MAAAAEATNNAPGLGQGQSERLFTRSFTVDLNLVARRLQEADPGKKEDTTKDRLIRFLKQRGLEFKSPETIGLVAEKNWVIARSTSAKLDKLELLIAKLNRE